MNLNFTSPQFLYILPLLAIPVVLHLISRNNAIDLIFPAIRFLKIGQIPKQQKRRIKDILLLIARCLIISMIILLLAGPQLRSIDSEKEKENYVIVIDTGIIRFTNDYYNLLEKALNKIPIDLKNKEVKTIFVSNGVTEYTGPLNINNILQKAKSIPDYYQDPDFTSAFKLSSDYLSSKTSELYFISNVRRSTFQKIPLNVFHKDVKVHLVNLETSNKNIGILSADSIILPDTNKLRIMSTINNDSSKDENFDLILSDGTTQEIKSVSVKANQQTRFVIETDANTNHDYYLLAKVEDNYALDNIFYLRSPNKLTLNGLLISDFSNYSIEKAFVEEALKVFNENLTPIELKSVDVKSNDWLELDRPHFIFLSGCASDLSMEKIKLLKDFVLAGSILICTPGDKYKENLNILNSNGLIFQSAGPLIASEYKSEPFFIEAYDKDSEIFKIFSNDDKSLFSTTIKKYIKLFTHGVSENLLETNNHNPLLVLNRIGKGQTFLFALNLNLEWSALPVSTIFVPLIRELIQKSVSLTDKSTKITEVGSSIQTDSDNVHLFTTVGEKVLKNNPKSPLIANVPGNYKTDDLFWSVNPKTLNLNDKNVSKFEFNNKVIDNKKNAVSIELNLPIDLSNYIAMALLLFLIIEIIIMTIYTKMKVRIS